LDCKNLQRLQCTWHLTLILLTWRIWRAPNNASRWQMGLNLAFKGLNVLLKHNINKQTMKVTLMLVN
jgi:hypothetical protein